MTTIVSACAGTRLQSTARPGCVEEGIAAYYSDRLHGKKTASGEPYDKEALTASHRALPFGTEVRVTALRDRRAVEVRINDRGPFRDRRRVIDLSRKAAERLGMIDDGLLRVRVEVISIKK